MSEPKITKIIYDAKLEEFVKRLEELQNPSIYYVSDLIYCPLKRRFRLRFPYLSFVFEPVAVLGELVHKGLQGMLSSRGYEIEYEVAKRVPLDNGEATVKGRVDALSSEEVIEIKTSRGPAEKLPYPHHLLQVRLYMELTGRSKGVLIYLSSDKILEYRVDPGEPVLEKLLRETADASVAPRWEWECKNCVFSRICPQRVNR